MSAPLTGVLRDGAASRPRYSLRTFTRALRAASTLVAAGLPPLRAVYEGLCMSMLTQLEDGSAALLLPRIQAHLMPLRGGGAPGGGRRRRGADSSGEGDAAFGEAPMPAPRGERGGGGHVCVGGFWLPRGPLEPRDTSQRDEITGAPPRYVLVPSVARHLRNLSRAVLAGRAPVLLEGATSSGKTSLVEFLAALTGHECVRINNHEHTDVAEYLGSYVTCPTSGRLVYVEGLLVQALRRGQWLILDELNLAPSEVLEALNRLLDDNRELFVPETQETVRPAPSFMLFATQNPAGLYGGRKPLSQAFRNRFLELHLDDIPPPELVTILTARARLPQSFAERMVAVMEELQRLRQGSAVFQGKAGFITPRDLLRWAGRSPSTYAALAEEGYMLLAERLRMEGECAAVGEVLRRLLRVELNVEAMYDAPFARAAGGDGAALDAAAAVSAAPPPLTLPPPPAAGEGGGSGRSAKRARVSGGGAAVMRQQLCRHRSSNRCCFLPRNSSHPPIFPAACRHGWMGFCGCLEGGMRVQKRRTLHLA